MFIFVAVSLIIKFPAHMGIKRVRSHLSLIFNVNSKGFIRLCFTNLWVRENIKNLWTIICDRAN